MSDWGWFGSFFMLNAQAQALWKVVLFATQVLPCGPRCNPFVQDSRADRSSSRPLQAAISQQSEWRRQILLWPQSRFPLLLMLANSWILSISLQSLEGDGCRHSHGGHGHGPIWELKTRYCVNQLADAKGQKAQWLDPYDGGTILCLIHHHECFHLVQRWLLSPGSPAFLAFILWDRWPLGPENKTHLIITRWLILPLVTQSPVSYTNRKEGADTEVVFWFGKRIPFCFPLHLGMES